MTTFIYIFITVLAQACVASIVNLLGTPTRVPKNGLDFLLLTTLPYVVYCKFFRPDLLR